MLRCACCAAQRCAMVCKISCVTRLSGLFDALKHAAMPSLKAAALPPPAPLRAVPNSVLFLGRPGVGKTTVIREMARVLTGGCAQLGIRGCSWVAACPLVFSPRALPSRPATAPPVQFTSDCLSPLAAAADELHKRVVIVDTSNEIGGDGDVPHPAIGGARRMQVPDPSQQHKIMVGGWLAGWVAGAAGAALCCAGWSCFLIQGPRGSQSHRAATGLPLGVTATLETPASLPRSHLPSPRAAPALPPPCPLRRLRLSRTTCPRW